MRVSRLAVWIMAIAATAGIPTLAAHAQSVENPGPPLRGPAVDCASLLGAFGPDGMVEMAVPQAEGTDVKLSLWKGTFDVTTPAHCLVRGSMARRTGTDGKPYAIGFELRLPARWNGRFLFQGGAHLAGRLHAAVGGAGTNNPLASGFAIVTTDSGHREGDGPGGEVDFAFDAQARIDFAYNGVARTTIAAKMLIQRYYGMAAQHSYFIGCSEGGRQGMMAAQRFPSFFDGIASGAPSLHLANISAARTFRNQSLAPFAPRDEKGVPDLSKTLSQADLQLVASSATAACDGLDGIRDGIIANRGACRFTPETLLCKPGQTSGCLTREKLSMVKAVTGPATTSAGHMLYPGFPIDAGIGDLAWYIGHVTYPRGEDDRGRFILYTTPPITDVSPFLFDLDQWEEKAAAMNALIDPASADLSSFAERGGKILFYHGISDPYMSANSLVRYYERLKASAGGEAKARDFSRLFLAPGMGHCTGGPAPNRVDMLSALVDWVEKGHAPERLIASGQADRPDRTRPLCPYPLYAHYEGGDREKAASFACRRQQGAGTID